MSDISWQTAASLLSCASCASQL